MSTMPYQSVVAFSQTDSVATECMDEMARHLESILALDGLESFIQSRELPALVFSAFDAALAAYDRYIAHIIAGESLAVSCRAGCAACCRHELARGVTLLEILRIYHHVRPWPDIGAIYDSAGESAVAFKRLLAAELKADPRPLTADDPRIVSAHLAYNRLGRPCAFLDQAQGACRIYPVRPLVCRWFFNLSPAQWCEPSHPSYLLRNCIGIDPHQHIKELLAEIETRLGVHTLNYLPGAFADVAGDLLEGQPIRVVN